MSEPSPELDVRVHAAVFGTPVTWLHCLPNPETGGLEVCPFCTPEFQDEITGHDHPPACRSDQGRRYPCFLPTGSQFHEVLPEYSRRIDAAEIVLGGLNRMPWYRGIEISDAPSQGLAWTCRVWGKRDGVIAVVAVVFTQPTPALAICAGALKAVEAYTTTNICTSCKMPNIPLDGITGMCLTCNGNEGTP